MKRSGPSKTLLAYKALALCDDLTGTERRVAAAIIDHFNQRTDQCDPSVTTLAELLSISRRSVIRATQSLERKGYVRKSRHGGKFHRNSYEPAWERFQSAEQAWTERRRRFSRKSSTSEMSPFRRQGSHLADDKADTQTFLRNSLEETYPDAAPPQRAPCTPSDPIGSKRPGKVSTTDKSHSVVDERFHVKAVQARDVLRDVAERRWNDTLMRLFARRPDDLAKLIEAIDSELSKAATDAELHRQGDGAELILKRLGIERVRGGPS